MTHRSDPDLLVLHALRLKGFAEPPAVSEAVAIDEVTVAERLVAFQERELVKRRDGRVSGFMLLPPGKDLHSALLDADRAAAACDAADRGGLRRVPRPQRDVQAACAPTGSCAPSAVSRSRTTTPTPPTTPPSPSGWRSCSPRSVRRHRRTVRADRPVQSLRRPPRRRRRSIHRRRPDRAGPSAGPLVPRRVDGAARGLPGHPRPRPQRRRRLLTYADRVIAPTRRAWAGVRRVCRRRVGGGAVGRRARAGGGAGGLGDGHSGAVDVDGNITGPRRSARAAAQHRRRRRGGRGCLSRG